MASSLALALVRVRVPIRWRVIEDTAETSPGLDVHAQGYTPVHTGHTHTHTNRKSRGKHWIRSENQAISSPAKVTDHQKSLTPEHV